MKLRAIHNDEWPDMAKRLPIGGKRRGFHQCQTKFNKTSFEYGRDKDGVWCKCYRCGYARHLDLEHAPYQVAEVVQAKVPDDVRPLVELIAKRPALLMPVLEREGLMPHISQLTASETYGRIYLPDDTASFCGLDFTGKQFIPWRSPHKHSLAVKVQPKRQGDEHHYMWVYSEAADYVEHIRGGGSAAFVANVDDATIEALVSVVLAFGYTDVAIRHPSAARLRRELSVCGRAYIVGE